MDQGWRLDAACRGQDTEVFFPTVDARPALEICASCPVTSECLDFAIRNEVSDGVYGGKVFKQRRGRVTVNNSLVTFPRDCRLCNRAFYADTRNQWYCTEKCADIARREGQRRSYMRNRAS